MSRRNKRWVLIFLLTFAVLSGLGLRYLGGHDPVRRTAQLNDVLEVLRQNAVTHYRNDDWCRYVSTSKRFYGTHAASPTDACLSNNTQPTAFDDAGRTLFGTVEAALKASGLGNLVLDVYYTPDGVVNHADFELDQFIGHDTYLYVANDDPPAFPKGRVTRLGANWFYYQND